MVYKITIYNEIHAVITFTNILLTFPNYPTCETKFQIGIA